MSLILGKHKADWILMAYLQGENWPLDGGLTNELGSLSLNNNSSSFICLVLNLNIILINSYIMLEI